MAKAGDFKSPYRGKDIDRRSFLKHAGGGIVSAGVFTGGTTLLYDRENRVKDEVGVGMVVSGTLEGVNILWCCGKLGSGGPVSVDGSAIMS